MADGCPLTIGGKSVYELDGSGSLSYTLESATGTRIFQCAYADRIDVARELLGIRKKSSVPDQFPDDNSLECKEVSMDGFGALSVNTADENQISYDYARITAVYRQKDQVRGANEDKHEMWRTTVGMQVLSSPEGKTVWSSDSGSTDAGLPVTERTNIMIPILNHTAIIRNLIQSPEEYLFDYFIGKINDVPTNFPTVQLYIHGRSITEYTLLCTGADITPRLTSTEVRYDLTMQFQERIPVKVDTGGTTQTGNWLTLWHPGDEKWYEVDPQLYELGDFVQGFTRLVQLQTAAPFPVF